MTDKGFFAHSKNAFIPNDELKADNFLRFVVGIVVFVQLAHIGEKYFPNCMEKCGIALLRYNVFGT